MQIDYLSSGSFYYAPGGFIVEHSHKYYQLFFVISGKCVFYKDKKGFYCTEDDFFLFQPDTVHSMKTLKDSSVRIIDVKFNIKDSDLKYRLKNIPAENQKKERIYTELFRKIFIEGKNKEIYFEKMVSLCVTEILFYLVRQDYKLSSVGYSEERHSISPELYEKLGVCTRQTICLLEEHIMKHRELTISDMADILGYTKEYIEKCFSREVGVSIKKYFIVLRIDKAKELLYSTELKIAKIASIVGYDNCAYFSRVFKKLTGQSPEQFRKEVRKKGNFRPLQYGYRLEERKNI